jgi:hypothetical protein
MKNGRVDILFSFMNEGLAEFKTAAAGDWADYLNFKHFAQPTNKLNVSASIASCFARGNASQVAANWS